MTKVFILIGVILLICITEWIREIVTFKVTHYDIKSEKLDGLSHERKIVFLSDLHNNCYGKNNEKLLAAVKEQKPDLILVGGDMLVGKKSNTATTVALDFVSKLAPICPVYYANGNHEYRMKIYPETYGTQFWEYKEALVKAGIQFLENEYVDLLWEACPIRIYGLEIPAEKYKKFKRMELSVQEIEKRIGTADEKHYKILLAHNPTYTQTYLDWNPDLILSGHFHGGVVRIPGLGGIITPQWHIFPKYSGELTVKDGKSVVVSKGLGTHTINVRFLNSAELVVLHIGGKES